MSKNTDLIIFGASGDLANRKLFPALYRLHHAGLLEDNVRILALARRAQTSKEFVFQLENTLQNVMLAEGLDKGSWKSFNRRLHFLKVDFTNKRDFKDLQHWLVKKRTVIYYFATPPSLYGPISSHLNGAGCIDPQTRIVLEKPIGHDLKSSQEVNDVVGKYFDEKNIYRIDHYLGKETVQNLLALRFANRVIHSQWDNTCIDHVQITAAETVGIEGRWSYYDSVGQLRDMVQNHLLQLLCMVAMEPPNSLEAGEIRGEKVKLMRALRPINIDSVLQDAVRGQYDAGWINGEPVVGYLEEEGRDSGKSNTETFVALKAYVDNWRWAGVPFYLRTGKRMGKKVTRVIITYKESPHTIFSGGQDGTRNRLVIRLQPNEGIELEMVSKKQSLEEPLGIERRILNLDFLGDSDSVRIADAYERLFLEVINGNQWLFVSREEIEASWEWCDELLSAWREKNVEVKSYGAGSWGPPKAEILIERDGRSWYEGGA